MQDKTYLSLWQGLVSHQHTASDKGRGLVTWVSWSISEDSGREELGG